MDKIQVSECLVTTESQNAWYAFVKAFQTFSEQFVHGDVRKPNVLYGRTRDDQENFI